MNRTAILLGSALLAIAGIAAAWAVADAYFLPEENTRVDQPLPTQDMGDGMMEHDMEEGMMEHDMANMSAGPKPVATGAFTGADRLHSVSGTVTLYHDAEGAFLRFEDYEATDGPDVYYYLARSGEPIESGIRVLVPGGNEGRATLRGNFNVPLEGAMDWTTYDTIVVWCDRFDVTFGTAEMMAV